MTVLVSTAFGAFFGWITGYMMIMWRLDGAGPLAQVVGSALAPTAPDTILSMAIGAVCGLALGLIIQHSRKGK